MKTKLYTLLFFLLNYLFCDAQGCFFNSTADFGGTPTIYSGNAYLDQFLSQEYYKLVQVYGVQPNSFYIIESGSPNAYASSAISKNNYQDGTVVLGLKMINDECSNSQSGTCVSMAVVMAHEFAHIFDFKNGIITRQSPKFKELFADYMAGAYLFTRELSYASTNIPEAAKSIFEKGDYAFNSPLHHGTGQERYNALMAGYNFSKISFTQGRYTITPQVMANEAKKYLGIR